MTEQDEGARGQIDESIPLHRLLLQGQFGACRVENEFPARMKQLIGDSKSDGLMVRIQQQQEILVLDAFARAVADFGSSTVEKHAEGAHPAPVLPVLGLHALAVRPEPDDILLGVPRFRVLLVKGMSMEIRML